MNKTKFYGCLGILALAGTMFTACSDDDDNNGKNNASTAVWTVNGGINACDHVLFTESDKAGSKDVNDKGTQIGNGDQEFVFTGKQTLKKGTYILKGWVYIADGAELTIEPGTVIKGDKDTKAALIAERGGKLIAQGSETQPIVFTSEQAAGSRRPGDWGGIIICGKARTNATEQQIEGGPRTKHGGNDDNDNSGVLSYVRIEFAGYPFATDQEINGLTLGSVGKQTKSTTYRCLTLTMTPTSGSAVLLTANTSSPIRMGRRLRYRQRIQRPCAVWSLHPRPEDCRQVYEQRIRKRQQRKGNKC